MPIGLHPGPEVARVGAKSAGGEVQSEVEIESSRAAPEPGGGLPVEFDSQGGNWRAAQCRADFTGEFRAGYEDLRLVEVVDANLVEGITGHQPVFFSPMGLSEAHRPANSVHVVQAALLRVGTTVHIAVGP